MSPQTPDTGTLISHAVAEAYSRSLRERLAERSEEAGDEPSEERRSPISAHELWSYLNRDADAPADFRIEGALRGDEDTRAKAARMLQGRAIGYSPMAMAAATGGVHKRVIGDFQLELVEAAAARMLVLSPVGKRGPVPTVLEAIGEGDHVRIRLPLPVRGNFQIPLNVQNSELGRLESLLRDTETQLFLL